MGGHLLTMQAALEAASWAAAVLAVVPGRDQEGTHGASGGRALPPGLHYQEGQHLQVRAPQR